MEILIETLFSKLISMVLDRMLPNARNQEIRNKQGLARFLLRIVAIIDAYASECEHLQTIVREWEEHSSEDSWSEMMVSSVRRLSNLNQEFTQTLREIDYLRLFDEDFHRALHSTRILEKSMLVRGLSNIHENIGFIDAGDLMRVSYNDDCVKFQFPVQHEGTDLSTSSSRHRTYSLRTKKGREELLTFIAEVVDSLRFSYERVSVFLQEHFEPWELFPIRKKKP
jgi:hypothetical protein